MNYVGPTDLAGWTAATGATCLQMGCYARDRGPTNFRYFTKPYYDMTPVGPTGQVAVVYVGDQPTFAACTVLEPQAADIWTDGSIHIPSFNQGVFPPGTTVYPYVCPEAGAPGTAVVPQNSSFVTGPVNFPLIITGQLPSATVGTPYNFTPVVTGGTPPYKYYLPSVNTAPPGVVVQSPFVVSGSDFVHGSKLVIQYPTGFPSRLYGNAAMLWDDVDHQFVNGVNQNAYAGFTDGQTIGTTLIYGGQSSGSGPDHMGIWTSQPRRTQYQSAVYGTVNFTISNGKSYLGNPFWPIAWGTRNNSSMYLSFWGMSVNPFTLGTTSLGAGTFTNKMLRYTTAAVGSANDPLIGIDCFAGGGSYTSNSNNSQGDNGPYRDGSAMRWLRHEFWLEAQSGASKYSTLGNITEAWTGSMGAGQRYVIRNHSSRGGAFEACHPADAIYSPANLPTDSWWDTQNFPAALPYSYVNTPLFGFDDSGTGGGSLGNSYYISEVYADPDLGRFELSDSPVWDAGPTSTMNRELCGQATRDSNTQYTVTLNFGQFPAGRRGLYLWFVTGRTTATLICYIPMS
jgi:hypothetical protein